QIAARNGCPTQFIENQIRNTLNRYYDKENQINQQIISTKIKPVDIETSKIKINQCIVLDVPFTGQTSKVYGKRLRNLGKAVRPTTVFLTVSRPPPTVRESCRNKDPIPKDMQSKLVYKIECNDCESVYIGETDRQAARRFEEHGCISNLLKSGKKPPPPTATTLTTTQPVRQSQRQRHKSKLYEFEEEDIPEDQAEDNVIQTFEQHVRFKIGNHSSRT
ncbi:unnamed protein product, partial [Didymodactylos carnosus]